MGCIAIYEDWALVAPTAAAEYALDVWLEGNPNYKVVPHEIHSFYYANGYAPVEGYLWFSEEPVCVN